jgi:predicted secreted protein
MMKARLDWEHRARMAAIPFFWRLRQRRDHRSGRVVAVIECALNQNARDFGAARFPAANNQIVDLLRRYEVGIVQIACPEIACLGLKRSRPSGMSLRAAMETPTSRERCASLAKDTAKRLHEYVNNGVRVIAILGGDTGSPGCAVLEDPCGTGLAENSGLFIKALAVALSEYDVTIPFRGLRDSSVKTLSQDVEWLEAQLKHEPA